MLTKGQMVFIESYKHDGSLHRTWTKGKIIDANDDVVILVNNKTLVSESDGRNWYTREPAVCFFFPHRWFNVICMIRKNGLYYYCNLASPCVVDHDVVKYIDYDLDVKIFPDHERIILDEDEYAFHSKLMDYPNDVKMVVEKALEELLYIIDHKKYPFDEEYIYSLYEQYLKMNMK